MAALALIDTNVLVYRFDERYPQKQQIAVSVLRSCVEDRRGRVPHQALVEFFRVATRSIRGVPPLLTAAEAHRETEEAYAEVYGIPEILSEDFQHDRLYGTVRVINPFVDASGSSPESSQSG